MAAGGDGSEKSKVGGIPEAVCQRQYAEKSKRGCIEENEQEKTEHPRGDGGSAALRFRICGCMDRKPNPDGILLHRNGGEFNSSDYERGGFRHTRILSGKLRNRKDNGYGRGDEQYSSRACGSDGRSGGDRICGASLGDSFRGGASCPSD